MIIDAIEKLCDASETIETRETAQTLLPAVCDFSFLYFLFLWNNGLEEVNHNQKYLQTREFSFKKSVIKMRSLNNVLKYRRNNLVKEAFHFAKSM